MPRGDRAGFVRVPDDATLAFPDRRGDHRLDTPGNIVVDPRVAPLFMVPPVAAARVRRAATAPRPRR